MKTLVLRLITQQLVSILFIFVFSASGMSSIGTQKRTVRNLLQYPVYLTVKQTQKHKIFYYLKLWKRNSMF